MEFENSNKLKGYLKKESKRLKIHSNYIYTMYFLRKFLEKINQYSPEEFIVKGSISQFAGSKKLFRPLTDLDIISDLKSEKSLNIIKEIELESKKAELQYKIKEEFKTQRNTTCLKIMCNFDKIEHMIRCDLKREKSFYKVKSEMPKILNKDKVIIINNIPIEQHIANKIYVIMKFLNLYSLIKHEKYDLNLIEHYFKKNIQLYGEFNFNYITSEIMNQIIKDNEKKYIEDSKKYQFLEKYKFEEIISKTEEVINYIKK